MARRPLHSVRHRISRPPSGVLAHCYWISAALPGRGLCETKEEGGRFWSIGFFVLYKYGFIRAELIVHEFLQKEPLICWCFKRWASKRKDIASKNGPCIAMHWFMLRPLQSHCSNGVRSNSTIFPLDNSLCFIIYPKKEENCEIYCFSIRVAKCWLFKIATQSNFHLRVLNVKHWIWQNRFHPKFKLCLGHVVHNKHIWKESSYRHIFGCLQKTAVKTYFCWPLYTSWMTCSLNFAVYDQKMHNIALLREKLTQGQADFCWHLIPLLPALDLLCQCWRFDKKWGTQEQNIWWWLWNLCTEVFIYKFFWF